MGVPRSSGSVHAAKCLVRTVGNRAHPRPHHDSAAAGDELSDPPSGRHLATNAGTDCAGAPTPGPEMREIESLVERFLSAEHDLAAAVDAAGGRVPLPDGRTVSTGRAEFDAVPGRQRRRAWVAIRKMHRCRRGADKRPRRAKEGSFGIYMRDTNVRVGTHSWRARLQHALAMTLTAGFCARRFRVDRRDARRPPASSASSRRKRSITLTSTTPDGRTVTVGRAEFDALLGERRKRAWVIIRKQVPVPARR
jgi:hypothetical protein